MNATRPRPSSATSEKLENGRSSGERSPVATSALGVARAHVASPSTTANRTGRRTASVNASPVPAAASPAARTRGGRPAAIVCRCTTPPSEAVKEPPPVARRDGRLGPGSPSRPLGLDVADELWADRRTRVPARSSARGRRARVAPGSRAPAPPSGRARCRTSPRVALRLAQLAEEEPGGELSPHALHERRLRDRPLLLSRHGARGRRGTASRKFSSRPAVARSTGARAPPGRRPGPPTSR